MNEPLNCPFCGSDDISSGEVLSSDADGSNFAKQSECLTCGALGPKAMQGPGEIDFGDGKAIEAWNRRAPTLHSELLADIEAYLCKQPALWNCMNLIARVRKARAIPEAGG